MFKTRLLSGIILVCIALFTIITGGSVLFATVTMIAFIGLNEFLKVFNLGTKGIGFLSYGISLCFYGLLFFKQMQMQMMLVLIFLVLLMAFYVFSFPKYQALDIMAAFFGVIYVSVMLSYIYQTRMLPKGVYIIWLIFISSWGCDTCAYCVGVLIGKHKLAPILSPKKSIEGAIGGIFGAGLLGGIYGFILDKQMIFSGKMILVFIGISAVGAIISQVGDLAASGIKRNHEIKDYGKLIPGHGGILDRFDSVIFTAPIIYYLAFYFIK